MVVKTVDVRQAQRQLKELLALIAEGNEILLVEDDTPVARPVPPAQRKAGLHPGAIWVSSDFDEPLPDDFWTGNQ